MACAATGCGVCAFAAAPAVTYIFSQPQLGLSGPQDMGPLSDLPDGEAILKEFPGILVMVIRKGDKLTAINASCTHLGCALAWDGEADRIRCNCHGGVFTAEGVPISGPPPKNQAPLPVKVEDGQIIVTL